ncbi:polyprenyl diphosphate synthase [Roseomonas marmotae]|uniref:Isoprenyl transferase n=1 Tax=Roseomonas marmotae TaxID=2768161 RepID=A0ABS3K9Y3_9PROT|nr:polyprenyl diphosphate synthase [Roseomonas marmotae]MBO1074278.1 di-trans,poly-cis-decaprenylcistransferase [Roseomonas marmotae]QTI78032.1 di-trans,poly-cis-decaprenylcistransferase [Roseomonas marmotae]
MCAASGAASAINDGTSSGVPVHVGIIMDGNRRWARARGLPAALGHKAGADAVRRTVEAAAKSGIGWLTLFAFSSENWQRSEEEVRDLTGLLRFYLRHEIAALHRNKVRLRVIGDRNRFGPETVAAIREAEALTAGNTGLNLTVALSYGSRAEIVTATRTLAQEIAAGRLAPDAVDEEMLERCLSTHGMPDPDLIIRTSGEQRLSNFLLWQAAYAELWFTETLWPDFGAAQLAEAVACYARRERRYGAG